MKEIDKIVFIYLNNGKILSILSKEKILIIYQAKKEKGLKLMKKLNWRMYERINYRYIKRYNQMLWVFKAQVHVKAEVL